jgi:hypothetical protein
MNDEARMTNYEGMTKTAMSRDSDEAFWNDAKAPVIREEPGNKRVYDLEERTARFGEAVIDFTRAIPQDAVTNRIINQPPRGSSDERRGIRFSRRFGGAEKMNREIPMPNNQRMTFVIQASSFLRHFPHAH